jgi:hypothetical protein
MATRNQKAQGLKTPSHIMRMKDEFGNELISEQNNDTILLHLALKEENYRNRKLGTISKNKRVFEVKRERSKHLFNKMNGYGFNYHVLKNAQAFDNVLLKDEFSTWLIPREFILDNGKIMNFKNNGGFELQIFVSLEKIQQFISQAMF